jgi:carbonic anhydrase/acetyltransferase-like protein (isoleucine patch superfamily)
MSDKHYIFPFQGTKPTISDSAWIAPGAAVIGDVVLGADASVWFNCTVRGDVNYIRIGARTNIQDNTCIHVTRVTHPTLIGANVTIGHSVTLHGCELQDGCFIGMGATILDGAVVESGAYVAAGALVTPGKRVKSGELCAPRKSISFRLKKAFICALSSVMCLRLKSKRLCAGTVAEWSKAHDWKSCKR